MKDIKQSSSLDSQQKWPTKIIHQSLLMVLEGIKNFMRLKNNSPSLDWKIPSVID